MLHLIFCTFMTTKNLSAIFSLTDYKAYCKKERLALYIYYFIDHYTFSSITVVSEYLTISAQGGKRWSKSPRFCIRIWVSMNAYHSRLWYETHKIWNFALRPAVSKPIKENTNHRISPLKPPHRQGAFAVHTSWL